MFNDDYDYEFFDEEDIYNDDDYDYEEDDDYYEDDEETVESYNESISSALVNIPEVFGSYNGQLKYFQKDLKEHGILFLNNYWCCQSCAGSSLTIDFENGDLNDYFGYCYYHNQDLEGFEKNGKLYLAWGCLLDGFNDNNVTEIGNKIVEIAQKHNFTINWNGSTATRIIIQP